MASLIQGTIVLANVRDPQGGNPKTRPLVLVDSTSAIRRNEVVVAVAITSQFSEPLADDAVLLPWHPQGLVRTRLRKPSVAKCSWMCEVRKSDVLEVKGCVPPSVMEKIIAYLNSQ